MKIALSSLSIIIGSCLLCLQASVGFALDRGVTNTNDTSGVYIKGSIGVWGDDTIGLFGDVYLDHAKQVGDGIMALVDTQSQLLFAENSSINNLLIHNPSQVNLIGNLTIINSLTIDTGVFDVQQGMLIILPIAVVILRNSKAILRNTAIAIEFQNNIPTYFLKAVFATTNLPLHIRWTNKYQFYPPNFYKFRFSTVLRPPPEVIQFSPYNSV